MRNRAINIMLKATRPIILRWLQIGKKEGATHMLLVEDVLADEMVPVYVTASENLNNKVSRFDDAHAMRLKAIFNLRLDLETQLNTVYRPAAPES
jgi:hypothetical protein